MFDLKHGPRFVNGSPESVIDKLIRYDDWQEELNEINEFYRDYRQGKNAAPFDERESTEDERNAL